MNVKALIALLEVPGVGILRVRRLVEHFGSPEAVFEASLKEIEAVPDIGPKTAQSIHQAEPDYKFAEEQLQRAEEAKAICLTLWDENYPPLLKNIYDPPPFLFVQGSLDWVNQPALAVVGTRKPSQYGDTLTRSIVGGLVRGGMAIISGMARGVDSIAHKAALEAGGKTAAVFGCGLDITYPPEHRKLREEIQEKGAVLSEFYFGTEPEARNFPQRNRTISGMCLGTLVVEAGDKSGALITAHFAVNQNREVFALPGDITRPQSMGCNRLIRESGALLVSSEKDILQALRMEGAGKPSAAVRPAVKLSGDKQKIYQHLNSDPIYIDDLALKAEMQTYTALTTLLELELEGLVRKLQGNYYIRG